MPQDNLCQKPLNCPPGAGTAQRRWSVARYKSASSWVRERSALTDDLRWPRWFSQTPASLFYARNFSFDTHRRGAPVPAITPLPALCRTQSQELYLLSSLRLGLLWLQGLGTHVLASFSWSHSCSGSGCLLGSISFIHGRFSLSPAEHNLQQHPQSLALSALSAVLCGTGTELSLRNSWSGERREEQEAA